MRNSHLLNLLACALVLCFFTSCASINCDKLDLQEAIDDSSNLTQRGIAIRVMTVHDNVAWLEVRTGFSLETLATIAKEQKLDTVSKRDSSVKILSDLERDIINKYGFQKVSWSAPYDAYTPPSGGNTGTSTGEKSSMSKQCTFNMGSGITAGVLLGLIFLGLVAALGYSVFLNKRNRKQEAV